MLFLLTKKAEGDSSCCQDDCLFSATIQNSHGNRSLGSLLFYREESIITFNDTRLEFDYPARRTGADCKQVGPYLAKFMDGEPILSVRASVLKASKGLFHRRRYGEFSFQTACMDDWITYAIRETWTEDLGHNWTMLDKNGNPMAAVCSFAPSLDSGVQNYHIYVTERLNLKYGLILASAIMLLDAGLFPFGPKFTAPVPRAKQTGPSDDAAFFAQAEHDEWGFFGTADEDISLPDA